MVENDSGVTEVVVLALDGVVVADLASPIEVLGRTVLPDGQHPYRIRVASSRSSVQTEHFALRVPWRLDILEEADTVVVPGLDEDRKSVV